MALTASASLKLDKVLNMVLVAFKRRLALRAQTAKQIELEAGQRCIGAELPEFCALPGSAHRR